MGSIHHMHHERTLLEKEMRRLTESLEANLQQTSVLEAQLHERDQEVDTWKLRFNKLETDVGEFIHLEQMMADFKQIQMDDALKIQRLLKDNQALQSRLDNKENTVNTLVT